MHLILKSCGKYFSCKQFNNQLIDKIVNDPFFYSHLPSLSFNNKCEDFQYSIVKYNNIVKTFSNMGIDYLRHFPFFILSQIGKLLIKDEKYLIHGGLIKKNDTIIIILGPSGMGKSNILYNLIYKNIKGLEVICDDKFVIDFDSKQILYRNNYWSFRHLSINENANLKQSYYSNKLYLKNDIPQNFIQYKDIVVYLIRNSDINNKGIISLKDIMILLYNNILNNVSGNEACALNPNLVTSHYVNTNEKNILLTNLNIFSEDVKRANLIQGDCAFITKEIESDLLC